MTNIISGKAYPSEYLLLDLREAACELFTPDPSPYGIADKVLEGKGISWDLLFLQAFQRQKQEFACGMQNQAEHWIRGSSSFVSKDDAEFALEAYRAVFQNDALTAGGSAFSEFLLRLVAHECSFVFGPASNWIVEASECGDLVVVDTRSNKSDGLFSFKTDDGFTLVYNHDSGTWTDGDMEFDTIHGQPELFGWPVDEQGLPLFGYLTVQEIKTDSATSDIDEPEISF